MTPLEFNLFILIGTLCGTIQDTSPSTSHSVYRQHEDVGLALEISCIRSKRRDKYIQAYKELPVL